MKKYFDNICKYSKKQVYQLLKKSIINQKKEFVITINSELMMCSENNDIIENILLNKDALIIPDGVSISFSAKILKARIGDRYPGIELVEDLLKFINSKGKKLYIYGSKEEIINKFKDVVNTKYKKINIVGSKNGYDYSDEDFFEDVKKYNPDLILVALGVPKQELLINKYYNKFKKGVFIGVGGTIDVLSGSKKRAPKIFRVLRIEWLYRIIVEPKRIKRFIKYNLLFILRIIFKRKQLM